MDTVIQWKAPTNISSWVQRAGRAARAPGRTGLAVMIVEKTSFEAEVSFTPPVDVGSGESARGPGNIGHRGRGVGRGRGHARGVKRGAGYGVARGAKRGSYSGLNDNVTRLDEPTHIAPDAPGEGLYSYIQTTVCRRKILTMVFGNEHSSQS